jgi:hypothetical protein
VAAVVAADAPYLLVRLVVAAQAATEIHMQVKHRVAEAQLKLRTPLLLRRSITSRSVLVVPVGRDRQVAEAHSRVLTVRRRRSTRLQVPVAVAAVLRLLVLTTVEVAGPVVAAVMVARQETAPQIKVTLAEPEHRTQDRTLVVVVAAQAIPAMRLFKRQELQATQKAATAFIQALPDHPCLVAAVVVVATRTVRHNRLVVSVVVDRVRGTRHRVLVAQIRVAAEAVSVSSLGRTWLGDRAARVSSSCATLKPTTSLLAWA